MPRPRRSQHPMPWSLLECKLTATTTTVGRVLEQLNPDIEIDLEACRVIGSQRAQTRPHVVPVAGGRQQPIFTDPVESSEISPGPKTVTTPLPEGRGF
jgi:hypothetical protein